MKRREKLRVRLASWRFRIQGQDKWTEADQQVYDEILTLIKKEEQ